MRYTFSLLCALTILILSGSVSEASFGGPSSEMGGWLAKNAKFTATGDESGPPVITLYRKTNYKLQVRNLQYATWNGINVVVAILNDQDKALVALDDGTFKIVAKSAITIDDVNNDNINTLFSGLYTEVKTKDVEVKTAGPLGLKNIDGCANIPLFIETRTRNRLNRFSILLPAKENERCGPGDPYNSKFEGFLLSRYGFAISSSRMFFQFGGTIVSLSLDFDIAKLKSCSIISSEEKYSSLIDQTLKEDGGSYASEVEAGIEARLLKYTTSRTSDGCK